MLNEPDDPRLKGFRWRSIGPVAQGGRIDDIEAVEQDPTTYYLGFATGGLWKTTDNGVSWDSIFDTYETHSIGDIGIAPGSNINYVSGHAIFEATHGTAPKYANQDKVNPGSVILSGEMMLRHLGWDEAADAIIRGMDGAIGAETVTYDFHRLMEGATLVSCSGFARAIVDHM